MCGAINLVLRGPELHRGLGLMRPPRYFFSTPLEVDLDSITKNNLSGKRDYF